MDKQTKQAYQFFKANAGYIVGKSALCALDLARAEQFASESEFEYRWELDEFFDYDGWADDSVMEDAAPKFESGEWSPEVCSLYDSNGNHLHSLCGIVGADDKYRRVVEAELAGEVYYNERALNPVWAH